MSAACAYRMLRRDKIDSIKLNAFTFSFHAFSGCRVIPWAMYNLLLAVRRTFYNALRSKISL
ncbi:hypothetical protein MYVALT_F_03360 [Candidatus Vallotia tarda]|uniref:Uncharacterized protein n=1 Tax=Candidatus Vallotiella hemipterorum TaxID=1177213 RepID=A0A916NLS1_9BURK|nr:hypothetical protein MYVALT_F_03360 [Candidatus Vallotia tarda]